MKVLSRALVLALLFADINALQVHEGFAPEGVETGTIPSNYAEVEKKPKSKELESALKETVDKESVSKESTKIGSEPGKESEPAVAKESTVCTLKKLVSTAPAVANIQDRIERLRDLKPRIAAAVKEAHEIIKEVPTETPLEVPVKKTVVKCCGCEETCENKCDSCGTNVQDIAKAALNNMNSQSVSSLQPMGEETETVNSLAKRVIQKMNKVPEGPSVSKLARKAKNQIFGGVAGSLAREMLDDDEKEADKIAELELRDQEKLENGKAMKEKLDAESEDAAETLVKQTQHAEEVIKEEEHEEIKKIKEQTKEQAIDKKQLDNRSGVEKAYDNASLAILRKQALKDAKKAAGEDTTPDEQDTADKLANETAKDLSKDEKDGAKKSKEDKKDDKQVGVLVKKSISKAEIKDLDEKKNESKDTGKAADQVRNLINVGLFNDKISKVGPAALVQASDSEEEKEYTVRV